MKGTSARAPARFSARAADVQCFQPLPRAALCQKTKKKKNNFQNEVLGKSFTLLLNVSAGRNRPAELAG